MELGRGQLMIYTLWYKMDDKPSIRFFRGGISISLVPSFLSRKFRLRFKKGKALDVV
jgi:hypothetical protein